MGNRIPESSAPDHDALTAEEQRLGDLFELADQLAGDRVAQDAFLQSLTEADRQEIMTMLVYANALRIMGSARNPHPRIGRWPTCHPYLPGTSSRQIICRCPDHDGATAREPRQLPHSGPVTRLPKPAFGLQAIWVFNAYPGPRALRYREVVCPPHG